MVSSGFLNQLKERRLYKFMRLNFACLNVVSTWEASFGLPPGSCSIHSHGVVIRRVKCELNREVAWARSFLPGHHRLQDLKGAAVHKKCSFGELKSIRCVYIYERERERNEGPWI